MKVPTIIATVLLTGVSFLAKAQGTFAHSSLDSATTDSFAHHIFDSITAVDYLDYHHLQVGDDGSMYSLKLGCDGSAIKQTIRVEGTRIARLDDSLSAEGSFTHSSGRYIPVATLSKDGEAKYRYNEQGYAHYLPNKKDAKDAEERLKVLAEIHQRDMNCYNDVDSVFTKDDREYHLTATENTLRISTRVGNHIQTYVRVGNKESFELQYVGEGSANVDTLKMNEMNALLKEMGDEAIESPSVSFRKVATQQNQGNSR